MTKPKRRPIFLDLDGVLCDFVGGALAALGLPVSTPITEWNMPQQLGLSPAEFWEAQERDPEFWFNLQPYEGAQQFVRYLRLADHDLCFLTSPSLHPNCCRDKMRWVDRHFGSGSSRQMLVGPPKEWCAAEGRVLVDDSTDNCRKWLAAGGQPFLFARPWNENWRLRPSDWTPADEYQRILHFLQDLDPWNT